MFLIMLGFDLLPFASVRLEYQLILNGLRCILKKERKQQINNNRPFVDINIIITNTHTLKSESNLTDTKKVQTPT